MNPSGGGGGGGEEKPDGSRKPMLLAPSRRDTKAYHHDVHPPTRSISAPGYVPRPPLETMRHKTEDYTDPYTKSSQPSRTDNYHPGGYHHSRASPALSQSTQPTSNVHHHQQQQQQHYYQHQQQHHRATATAAVEAEAGQKQQPLPRKHMSLPMKSAASSLASSASTASSELFQGMSWGATTERSSVASTAMSQQDLPRKPSLQSRNSLAYSVLSNEDDDEDSVGMDSIRNYNHNNNPSDDIPLPETIASQPRPPSFRIARQPEQPLPARLPSHRVLQQQQQHHHYVHEPPSPLPLHPPPPAIEIETTTTAATGTITRGSPTLMQQQHEQQQPRIPSLHRMVSGPTAPPPRRMPSVQEHLPTNPPHHHPQQQQRVPSIRVHHHHHHQHPPGRVSSMQGQPQRVSSKMHSPDLPHRVPSTRVSPAQAKSQYKDDDKKNKTSSSSSYPYKIPPPPVVYPEEVVEILQDERLVKFREEAHRGGGDETVSFTQTSFHDKDKNRPAVFKKRQFLILSVFFCFLVCAILGVVAVGIIMGQRATQQQQQNNNNSGTGPRGRSSSSSSSNAPTQSPRSSREKRFRLKFFGAVGNRVDEIGSPHEKAAYWMIHDDPLALPIDAPNIMQRYTLVLFYYLTGPWKSCNPPDQNNNNNNDEGRFCRFQRLTRIPQRKPSRGDRHDDNNNDDDETEDFQYHEEPSFRWLSGEHECRWAGISCDESQVIRSIELAGQNITAKVPAELSLIPHVTSIVLPHNELYGSLPTELATMRQLITLDLHSNKIVGNIPKEYFDIGSFQQLDFADNLLEGTLCSSIGRLTNLKSIRIGQNRYSGQIPTEIGNLRFLSFLRVDGNRFHGSIPTEIGNMMSIRELWMQENRMYGTIPTQVGELTDLTDLRTFNNRFNGTIPEQLYELTKLYRLELSDMALTGTLSTAIGRLQRLADFRVRKNPLTGTVPIELAGLSKLETVWLHKTMLNGSVPEALCTNKEEVDVFELTADCLPRDRPVQNCKCCTGCCNRNTGVCDLEHLL